jgi:hypothetical protein
VSIYIADLLSARVTPYQLVAARVGTDAIERGNADDSQEPNEIERGHADDDHRRGAADGAADGAAEDEGALSCSGERTTSRSYHLQPMLFLASPHPSLCP